MHLQDATNRFNIEQSAASNPLADMHSSVRTPSYRENSLRDVPSGKTVTLKCLLSQTPSSAQATYLSCKTCISLNNSQSKINSIRGSIFNYYTNIVLHTSYFSHQYTTETNSDSISLFHYYANNVLYESASKSYFFSLSH